MGTKQDIVLIDTNVFIIDLRYHRDENYNLNKRFLETIKQLDRGFTTLVNLFEICGILSFNLNQNQLHSLWHYFPKKYGITVLPTPDLDANSPVLEQRRIFDIILKRTSYGDAMMAASIERYLPFTTTLVTWDDAHMKDIYDGEVINPREYLSTRS